MIGEVTRALIPTTKNEIRQRICEQFVASELYSFAWIDRYSPEKEEMIPTASAGIAKNTLNGLTINEEFPQAELTNEAVQTREVTVVQNLVDDPPCEEWRDHALKHDYRTCAAIPLVYEEAMYGVLHLATNRSQGFGALERESLAELGVTIAYAFENAESPANTDSTERTEAETEMMKVTAESEQERRLYETIISSTPDLVYAFDLDYRFIYANDALLEMWGQTYEESIGKTLLENGYEPWHAEMHEREIDQIVETTEPIRGEVAFQHAELGRRIYDYIFAPVLNDEGEVEAVTGTTRDITERKEAEEALQESKERFQALINASSDVVYRVSPDWGEIHRLKGKEFIADIHESTSNWLDKYIHPDDQKHVMEAVDEAIRTKSAFELEHQVEQVDGSLGWTFSRAVPMLDEDGDIVEWIGMASDITERKQYEWELKRALDLLEKTEQIADVGGWEIDVDTKEVFWTDYLFDILEVPYDEEPPLDEALDVYYEEDRPIVESAVEEALDTAEPFDVEARVRTPSGEIRWLRVQGDPEVEKGEVVSLRGAVQDITERKHREQRLGELIEELGESNERLEQFAYAASHDLQEPLRMVSSYLQLIERRYDDELDEDGREFIEFAVDGADRMRNMIQGLLEYSRVDRRGEPFEPVSLDDVLTDVRADLQVKIEEINAEITTESLPHVEGDRGQLRQLFQNLLDNAFEYSGDMPARVHVAAEKQGPKWVISVSDEGIGIAPDDSERIFEVFQSLNGSDEHQGTGIGLALCERIVERHDGDIWVESEPGEGATFSFTLPSVRTSELQP
ncbi:PAS domain-containing protein [Haloprofundus salilacus]|uniref:PAS domain-containing protein n=1 Tax=Haloprofundus salilacus TaxID=2876190 RepID=UPI001CCD87B3|nr:PAS domain-containing protein [Haloprofundus salilacus]